MDIMDIMDMFVYRGRDSDRNSDVGLGRKFKEPSTVSLARIIFIRCVAPRVLDLGGKKVNKRTLATTRWIKGTAYASPLIPPSPTEPG